MGAFKILRGRPVSSSANASLAFPNSGYRKLDTLSGFQTWLDTVDDTNLVTTTVAGTIPLLVWPLRSVDNTASRQWSRRQLREMLLVDGAGQTVGNTGTVTFSGKTGANGTGSTTTFVVDLTVDNTAPARYTLGAKTLARCGGPLLSVWGATSITTQKDSGGNVISTNKPFEVFGGRLVWSSSNGTSTTYGTTRVVPYASTTIGSAAYTVIFNNGTSLIIDTLDNAVDVAPTPGIMSDGPNGDNIQIAMALPNRYAGDLIRCEDGAYNNSGGSLTCWLNYGTTGYNSTGFPIVNPGGGPALPSSTEMTATAPYDLSTSVGWVRIQAMNPLGVTFNDPILFKPTGMGTNGDPMNFLFEYLDTRGAIDSFGQTSGMIGWTQDPSVLGSHPTANMICSWIAFRYNYLGGGGLLNNAAVAQQHHWFVHDNYLSNYDQGVILYATDSEVVGNWFDHGHDHDIHGAIYNSTTDSHFSKVWWNIHVNKWIIDGAAHPNFMQQYFSEVVNNGDRFNYLYYQNQTNSGAGWELASFIGNIGYSGERGFIGIVGAGYNVGDDAPDSQCYNTADTASGLIKYIALGNLMTVGNYNIGFSLSSTVGTSIFRDNGFMQSWSAPATLNGNRAPALILRGDGAFNGSGSTAIWEGNYACGVPLTSSGPWAGTISTSSSNPNVDNLSTSTLAAAAITTPDPGIAVNYLEDMLAAAAPVVAGTLYPSGKPGVGPLASGNYDFRRRTFNTARMTP